MNNLPESSQSPFAEMNLPVFYWKEVNHNKIVPEICFDQAHKVNFCCLHNDKKTRIATWLKLRGLKLVINLNIFFCYSAFFCLSNKQTNATKLHIINILIRKHDKQICMIN